MVLIYFLRIIEDFQLLHENVFKIQHILFVHAKQLN